MFKELLADAFPVIEKFAPAFASAISGPMVGLASKFALDLIANAFGIPPADLPALSNAIISDPKAPDCLSELEAKFGDWFKLFKNARMPSKAEFNVKLEWNDVSQG